MVVINGRFLSQRITGIQRFAYEICRSLQQIGADYVILAPEDITQDYDLKDLPVEIIGGRGSHLWEQWTLPRYMKRHYDGKLLLSLSGLSPLLYKHNIITIHDVSYLLRPRSYSWLYCTYYQFMTPLIAKCAERILTVSEFSKRELVERLGLEAKKIEVVYNAVRSMALLPKEDRGRYILAVSSLVPRKNIKRLLEAYCGMEQPDYELYIVGGMHAIYADAELKRFVQKKGVHFLGYVGGEELTALYRNATVYINPSLYEGFGIPLIEAMEQECPVVVSDIPAFHEVCADAAIYFNPMEVADIQLKMQQIMHDVSLRQELITLGREQAKHFNWDKSAEQIKKIIELL